MAQGHTGAFRSARYHSAAAHALHVHLSRGCQAKHVKAKTLTAGRQLIKVLQTANGMEGYVEVNAIVHTAKQAIQRGGYAPQIDTVLNGCSEYMGHTMPCA